jgi:hypothetical protein
MNYYNLHVVYIAEQKDGRVFVESMNLRCEIDVTNPDDKELMRRYIAQKGNYNTVIICKIEQSEFIQNPDVTPEADKQIAENLQKAILNTLRN